MSDKKTATEDAKKAETDLAADKSKRVHVPVEIWIEADLFDRHGNPAGFHLTHHHVRLVPEKLELLAAQLLAGCFQKDLRNAGDIESDETIGPVTYRWKPLATPAAKVVPKLTKHVKIY